MTRAELADARRDLGDLGRRVLEHAKNAAAAGASEQGVDLARAASLVLLLAESSMLAFVVDEEIEERTG